MKKQKILILIITIPLFFLILKESYAYFSATNQSISQLMATGEIIYDVIVDTNPNYIENLEFTDKISKTINEKVPGLSKGIYKKQGAGVNGVYNQDFSNRTILIEIGGPENTIDEVYETLLVLSEALSEVIKSDQN